MDWIEAAQMDEINSLSNPSTTEGLFITERWAEGVIIDGGRQTRQQRQFSQSPPSSSPWAETSDLTLVLHLDSSSGAAMTAGGQQRSLGRMATAPLSPCVS